MEVINATDMVAGYTMGTEPSGQESLVVVVKGTFTMPHDGTAARLHGEQVPLVMADTFTGEPGLTAPVDEADFAPHKRLCDVLLTGSAYAPEGRPSPRVPVGLRIGDWHKSFAVVGERRWDVGMLGVKATPPVAFVSRPISYDGAFGGCNHYHDDPALHTAFPLNPVGRGWHKQVQSRFVDGAPLPDTEELNRPVSVPDGDYLPMALGPVGRGWGGRRPLAGTYDQDWIDNTFPFLPADFNEAFYQAAPMDQQLPYPRGGEEVVLLNLTPRGRSAFRLPALDVPVVFFRKNGERHETKAVPDTIVLRPGEDLLTLTWRARIALKKDMFEIPQVLVGRMPRGWWRARELGKDWYPSLGDLVLDKRGAALDEES